MPSLSNNWQTIMASNRLGNVFSITTWGESHGLAVGVVIDGDNITHEEFEERMELNVEKLKKLVNQSHNINESIFSNLSNLL